MGHRASGIFLRGCTWEWVLCMRQLHAWPQHVLCNVSFGEVCTDWISDNGSLESVMPHRVVVVRKLKWLEHIPCITLDCILPTPSWLFHRQSPNWQYWKEVTNHHPSDWMPLCVLPLWKEPFHLWRWQPRAVLSRTWTGWRTLPIYCACNARLMPDISTHAAWQIIKAVAYLNRTACCQSCWHMGAARRFAQWETMLVVVVVVVVVGWCMCGLCTPFLSSIYTLEWVDDM